MTPSAPEKRVQEAIYTFSLLK